MGKLRHRLEQITSREKNLLWALAATLGVCVLAFAIFVVGGKMTRAEKHHAEIIKVLRLVEEKGPEYLAEQNRPPDPVTLIGPEAVPLASYLEVIANELKMQIPESTERSGAAKGKFIERALDIKLRGITMQQLADFLERVESRSPIVVTQRLYVRTYFRQPDKMDVELTIVTYEKTKKSEKDSRSKSS